MILRRSYHPARYLGLWDILDKTIVTSHGLYLRGLKVTGLNWQTTDGEILLTHGQSLYDDFKGELPDHTMIQCIVECHQDYDYLWDRYTDNCPTHPVLAYQRLKRAEFLKSRGFWRRELYLFFGNLKGLSTQEFQTISQERHKAKIREVKELQDKIRPILRRAGLTSQVLNEKGLTRLFYRSLNPETQTDQLLPLRRGTEILSPRVLKAHPQLRNRTVREQLMETPLSWKEDYLKLGERYYKVLSLMDLPSETSFTLAEWFVRQELDYRLSVTVIYPEQAKIQSRFQHNRRIRTATAHREHVQNDRALSERDEADALSAELAATDQKLVLVSTQVVLSDTDLERLKSKVKLFQEKMKEKRFSFFEENWAHDREFFKTLPGLAARVDRHKVLTSNNAVDLLPLFSHPTGDREPVLLLETPDRVLYSFDPLESARDNPHGVVFGATGKGKSVLVNMLIACAMLGHKHLVGRLLVVDYAGEKMSSYLNAANLFAGEYIPIISDKGKTINPFPPKHMALVDNRLEPTTFNFLSVLTDLLLINTGNDKEDGLYRVLLQRTILALYQRWEAEEAPRYADLLQELRRTDSADPDEKHRIRVISDLLEGFLESPNARFFNSPSTISTRNPFVIFDLQGVDRLPSNVREAMVFLVCWWVKQVAFDGSYRAKYVILDEVAQLIRQPAMIALFEELYSTARKHHTCVFTVSQKYQDYVKSSIAATVKVNSTSLFLLDHADAGDVKEQVIKDWELNGREAHLFRGLKTIKGEYSEILLKTQVWDPVEGKRKQSAKLRLRLSPFDLELSTTDPKDRQRQQDYFDKHPESTVLDALHVLAQERQRQESCAAW